MRFLVTVFWALVAVVVALFWYRNWTSVTLNLWGDIEADIKLPILLLAVFLLGWLPTWSIMRARLWTAKRRIEALERSRVTTAAAASPATGEEETVA